MTPPFSQLDIAPTAARMLGVDLPASDGQPIDLVEGWGCRNAAIIIVDSLGYDLMFYLLPRMKNTARLIDDGLLLQARAVSNHTTPAIASILSGLLPEHHQIFDKEGAKSSSIPSLPEIASAAGLKSAVIMESNGAEVYEGLIEIIHGISDRIPPEEFDQKACQMTVQSLRENPRLLVSYFIGIDKSVHLGREWAGIRNAALNIDRFLGEIAEEADEKTLLMICGDHPIHAGPLKRSFEPLRVALILARGRRKRGQMDENGP
ncbi:alkaline phosphatase family protein [Methanothrix sp.]|uniref:alkaline phosphatase family protein n=2 Tax=Methanothrix sp. TaxID=90426 RepID=UPI003C7511B5